MIIGINGYSGSGKDTIGTIIQYLNCTNLGNVSIEDAVKDYSDHEWWLQDQSGWEVMKFAGKLKDIASHLTGIDREKFEDQEFKKTVLGTEWWTTCDEGLQPMTVRDLLQKLGTECMRTGLHTNTWVNALFADYKPDDDGYYPNWVVTDTRFENEAKAIKDKKGIIIRVDRPGVTPINAHPSETGLDHWKFDYKIVNNSDLFDLKQSVKNILNHAGLL
jgi:ABC-type oligopeptide transport system ATPase subunit